MCSKTFVFYHFYINVHVYMFNVILDKRYTSFNTFGEDESYLVHVVKNNPEVAEHSRRRLSTKNVPVSCDYAFYVQYKPS